MVTSPQLLLHTIATLSAQLGLYPLIHRCHDTQQQTHISVDTSAANRLIGEVVQSRRRPLLGPSPG